MISLMSTARRCLALRAAIGVVAAGCIVPCAGSAVSRPLDAQAPARATVGTIQGRVVDKDGRPLPGITIEALAWRIEHGARTLVAAAAAESGASGEFALTFQDAGAYVVRAYDRNGLLAGDRAEIPYGVTYYPGETNAARAVPLELPAADRAPIRVTLALLPTRLANIAGVVRSPDRRLSSLSVTLRPTAAPSPAVGAPSVMPIAPDGAFVFPRVLPGQYQIQAVGIDEGGPAPQLAASITVLVQGDDIANLSLGLVPCAALSGRVTAEPVAGSQPPAFQDLRVRALPVGEGHPLGDRAVRINATGAFVLEGVPPGLYHFLVEGLRDPWVVQSIVHRGQDVTDVGVELAPGRRAGDVRVTIVDVASEVSGVVRDEVGRAVSNAAVVVAPPAPRFWVAASRRVAVVRAAANGRYSVRGLPPGAYHVAAAPGLDVADARLFTREFLQEVATAGAAVEVHGTAGRTIDAPVLSPAALGRGLSR